MLVVRLPIDPQKGYFNHCLSLRDPSSTSSSILLLPSHPPRAKYGGFDHSGPVLEGGPVHSLAQITKETAVTVVDHVFRIHGPPMDVVSDREPQFVS